MTQLDITESVFQETISEEVAGALVTFGKRLRYEDATPPTPEEIHAARLAMLAYSIAKLCADETIDANRLPVRMPRELAERVAYARTNYRPLAL